jgi:2-polyprenyl-3-methyl-5-hydroxy-6-metoxy-1,4-benzoquinol methylase
MTPAAGQRGDIAELVDRAVGFARTLQAAKDRVSPRDFEWYPYDSLSNLRTMERLLGGGRRFLLDLAGDLPVLDLGCVDGDLAFFFESLGCRVQAVDHPVSNFNAMRGVRALRAALGSAVEIHSLNMDARFHLPEKWYGLVLCLGVLYHLKNPFYLLETLSRHARYCLLSTTITEYVPGLYESIAGAAAAYLADVYEINHDSTNYWVFSDAALRRLLKRANWEISDYLLTSDSLSPSPGIAGQRAFCLARSIFLDGGSNILYGKGWHPLETGGWRWTEREFAIRVESSYASPARALRMTVFLPEPLMARFPAITLRAVANGIELARECFREPGRHEYSRTLPPDAAAEADVRVDFSLDHALPPDESDHRERGLVVESLEALPE